MSRQEQLPPEAQLMESMRSIGYSLDTAVADILDNSIAAGAKNITISFEAGANEFVSILDDGAGMAGEDLRTAMRFAGKPPSFNRSRRDLGRFGLGLKTASLSQAKRLTVATKTGGKIIAAVWDVDLVEETQSWSLEWLDEQEILLLPEITSLQTAFQGTLVLWQKLDVLLASQTDGTKALTNAMARTAEHLSLVFHRYLDGTPNDRLSITVNGLRLAAIDPFFTRNLGTQQKPATNIVIDNSPVTVTPYILPHLSQLSREERKESEFLKSRFRDTQGFYIYREKRLISYGSWFRIVGKTELAKLARVRVDTTNELDHAWKLGVTKSKLEPPIELRRALEHLVPNIIGDSRRVVQREGFLSPSNEAMPVWRFRDLGKHEFKLEISTEHPLLIALDSGLNEVQRNLLTSFLDQLQLALPVNELALRLLGDKTSPPTSSSNEELIAYANALYEAILGQFENEELAFLAVSRMEPFASQPLARENLFRNRGRVTNLGER